MSGSPFAMDSTPHHHPLPVEGRPQPTCFRSVVRTARKPPRPARKAPLTAMPAGRLTCAGRGGSSQRRALRYGRWAAAPSFSLAGGGAWMSSQPSPRAASATLQRCRPGLPHGRHAPVSGAQDPRGSWSPRQPRSRLQAASGPS